MSLKNALLIVIIILLIYGDAGFKLSNFFEVMLFGFSVAVLGIMYYMVDNQEISGGGEKNRKRKAKSK